MLQPGSTLSTERPRFLLALTRDPSEMAEAQELRHRVFFEEDGHRDEDRFDVHCEHLLVRECTSGAVVGTYRILAPDDALCAGGFYSETEFDVAALRPLLSRTVEIGRACVDPEYRHGGVIALLLSGLLRLVFARGYDYVMGCASIPVRDGGHAAATVCRQLLAHHLCPPDRRVHPHRAFVLEGWRDVPDPTVPPLIKGYLRLGAEVCGNPAWDGKFDTADLLMTLNVRNIEPRYVERLLRARA